MWPPPAGQPVTCLFSLPPLTLAAEDKDDRRAVTHRNSPAFVSGAVPLLRHEPVGMAGGGERLHDKQKNGYADR